MPGRTTVFRWLGEHEIFRNQYEKAQRERTVAWAEELADIADEASAETVQKARLQIDTRKWLMSKMAPKKYGDRVVNEHTGANGGPIQSHTLILDPEKLKAMTSDELAALEAAIGKLHGSAGDGEGRTDAEGDAEAYSGAIDGGEGELAP
jgi:hypothetical protein